MAEPLPSSPGVRGYTGQVRQIAERQPDAVVVLDAALLIETGYHRRMDKVIVVYASEDQQLKRLMDRDGLSGEQALARIRSQMPLDGKTRLSRTMSSTIPEPAKKRNARHGRFLHACKRESGKKE